MQTASWLILVPIVLNSAFMVGVLLTKGERNPTGDILADLIPRIDHPQLLWIKDKYLYSPDQSSDVS